MSALLNAKYISHGKVVVAWLRPASEDSDLAMAVILRYPRPQPFLYLPKIVELKNVTLKVEEHCLEQLLNTVAEHQTTLIRSARLKAAKAGIKIFSALKSRYD
jgi:hypothetical protein